MCLRILNSSDSLALGFGGLLGLVVSLGLDPSAGDTRLSPCPSYDKIRIWECRFFFSIPFACFFFALSAPYLDKEPEHSSFSHVLRCISIANRLHETLKASFQRFNGSCPCCTASTHNKSRPAFSSYAAALDAVCVTAAGPNGSQSDSGSSLCTARIRHQVKMFLSIFVHSYMAGWHIVAR